MDWNIRKLKTTFPLTLWATTMEIYFNNSTTAHIRAQAKNQTVSECEARGSENIFDKIRLTDIDE